MKNRNRFISLLLCASLIFSITVHSAPTVWATEKSVQITLDSQPINHIAIEQADKKTLSAATVGIESPLFQWQILLDRQNAVWVNIYDRTERNCEISYALVKSMLDDTGSAYIRCAVTSVGEIIYSNEVCIIVNPEQESAPQVTAFAPMRYDTTGALTDIPPMFSSARNTVTDYVTITIKYLDIASLGSTEESAIYSPYTATIARGTSFRQSVVSPTFLGFAPYLDSNNDGVINDEDASAASYVFNEDAVTENIEIKVYYKPIEVNFAVKYFFQNINDDLYTENASHYHTAKAETGTIISNEYLKAHAGDTTGFSKMYHIPESVAADGSTVFECYYDRNYYLIQFDLNGGYGIDPIYARYGAPFIVNDPIRHGYSFAGWKLLCIDTNGNGEWDDTLPDNASNDMISTIPACSYYYQAQWETVDTNYTVVYWLGDGNGNYDYVGSRIVSEKSGQYVSGSNDVATAQICGLAAHAHNEGDGCYGNCTETEHICSIKCYTTATLNLAGSQTGTVATVFSNLKAAVGVPKEGNVYKYSYRSGWITTRYNFFYYDSTWYYLDTEERYAGISVSGLSNPSLNGYTTAPASTSCGSGATHTHDKDCLSCKLEEHTHTDACKTDTTYFVYERADSNVLVEGDGSTVVNVYYKTKEYTLRFYYAATTGTGTDSDGDGVADTFASVKVIGGSTYSFGASGSNTSNDETLLNNIFTSTQVGTVTKLPQLNATGKARNYTKGTLVSGSTAYHYIEFTAGYGQDISGLWPCSVFESATRATANTHGKWNGTEAFVSAWNGEHHVWYSQHNANQTIKGKYEKLDDQLLFDPKFGDETTVSYLCFWENGANINWSVPELYTYKIWVPILAGESTDGLETKVHNGVTYKLIDAYDTCDDSSVAQQTQPSLEGYVPNGYDWSTTSFDSTLYAEGYVVNFYYTRQTDSPFAMKNYGEYIVNIKPGADGVPYGTKLSTLSELDVLQNNFTPDYPDTLEEDAYYFEGWYTTEQCVPGTKVDIASATMPSSGLILYANWVPQTHTARFFTTYDDMNAFENATSNALYRSYAVTHGQIIGSVDTPVRSGDGSLELTFAGWFYMDNGMKKAFSPLNMPINRDMNIFAEWSSHAPQPYRIHYVLLNRPDTKVADDTEGYAFGGTTRTFHAKAGAPYNQLYSEYNSGYFPTISSHSITIQAEEDQNRLEHNIFTFHYVKADDISYTVRYVNKETNVVMGMEEYTTTAAVVTERFKEFPDMVSDAFYKRLVLEVVWDEEQQKYVGTDNNVITFYYTPNDTSTYYAVHFMLEKPNATAAEKANFDIHGNGGYEESGAHMEGVGKVGSTIYIPPQTISGFDLIDNNHVPIISSGGSQSVATYSAANNGYGMMLTQSGAELYLFYERNAYPYKVYYYEYNTTNSLLPAKNSTAYFGSEVTETAEKIAGYTCVSEQTQVLTIREDDGSAGLNVIIFYYAPLQYVAEYVAVPNDGGWLSNTIEVVTGTEDLIGSVPTANSNCEFVGWYLDQACTQSASAYGTFDEATNRFTPDKAKLSETERNIFYAKFIKKVGDFTIQRSNAQDESQVFVYEIKNNDTGAVIYVTVTGNGRTTIKDVPLGKYTVTQQNDWSWRYNDAPLANVSHQNADGTTVFFSENEQSEQWLNGNSKLVKNQRGQ